jgi:hypothetical protein
MPFDVIELTDSPIPDHSEAAPVVADRLSRDADRNLERLELEVRMTAQAIVRRHLLNEERDRFWDSIDMDLGQVPGRGVSCVAA